MQITGLHNQVGSNSLPQVTPPPRLPSRVSLRVRWLTACWKGLFFSVMGHHRFALLGVAVAVILAADSAAGASKGVPRAGSHRRPVAKTAGSLPSRNQRDKDEGRDFRDHAAMENGPRKSTRRSKRTPARETRSAGPSSSRSRPSATSSSRSSSRFARLPLPTAVQAAPGCQDRYHTQHSTLKSTAKQCILPCSTTLTGGRCYRQYVCLPPHTLMKHATSAFGTNIITGIPRYVCADMRMVEIVGTDAAVGEGWSWCPAGVVHRRAVCFPV